MARHYRRDKPHGSRKYTAKIVCEWLDAMKKNGWSRAELSRQTNIPERTIQLSITAYNYGELL